MSFRKPSGRMERTIFDELVSKTNAFGARWFTVADLAGDVGAEGREAATSLFRKALAERRDGRGGMELRLPLDVHERLYEPRIARRVARRFAGDDDELYDAVTDFLSTHPEPDDKVFHEWAEAHGYDTHEAEAAAYKLATKAANFLKGGRASAVGFTREDADPDELAMGIEIEYEHTPDKSTAQRIALDHLAELDDYYTRLKAMEAEGEDEGDD